ncbi:MAG: hypothetical protein OEY19_08670 [Gammaproteobacteria bacterium]|nr:hypothetical protein [Gammaproteobacteria bacterium]MDH5629337.1 hypothetical protein [Gammaproteobacteria bacterium]
MAGSTLVIKQQKSLAWRISMGAAAALFIFFTYYLGHHLAVEGAEETEKQLAEVQEQLSQAEEDYRTASANLIMQQQSSKVDQQSREKLMESIRQLKENQSQLEEELAFYRRIMSPELEKAGLNIDEFKLSKNEDSGNINFKLVLIQTGKQERFLRGNADIKLYGKKDDKELVYNFSDLGEFQKTHFQFQFKYFQNIEGIITLPEGFVPEKVTVVAKTSGLRKNQKDDKQYDWTI